MYPKIYTGYRHCEQNGRVAVDQTENFYVVKWCIMLEKCKRLFYRGLHILKLCVTKWFCLSSQKEKSSKWLLKKIKAKMGPNSVAILTGMGVGDMLYAMGFVNAYLEKNPTQKPLIVARKEHAAIIDSFGKYDFFGITKLKTNAYSALLHDKSLIDSNENIICTYRVENCKQENMADKMRELFDIQQDVPIQYHALKPMKVSSIPNFYGSCKKIVILNPYSNSAHFSKELFEVMEKLVLRLKNAGGGGYTVYTNIIKDQLPIRGTKELRCGLAEFLEIAAHVPFIVSVRSGILDFVVKTNVNMLVLYPNEEYAKLYGLAQWRCGGSLKEITFDNFLQDRAFENVADFINGLYTNQEKG